MPRIKKKRDKFKNKSSGIGKMNLFQRTNEGFYKPCPLSIKGAPKIDYKNISLLKKYLSESGKIIPSRVTFVSHKKQKELTKAIKRARTLALL